MANHPKNQESSVARIVTQICLGFAIGLAVLFLLGAFDDSDTVLPSFGDLTDGRVDTEPWQQGPAGGGGGASLDSLHDALRWPSQGHGLSLTIVNAMDDSWQLDLHTAVQNWNEGYPVHPLSLRMETSSPDMTCQPVDGKLKICNGDYGATGWTGTNEVVINQRTNEIISSSARMNEYYLPIGAKQEERLYTLCHELGHGFGLTHWDEDFDNEDLGNCMDYTNTPQNNQRPDATNFLYLGELYGHPEEEREPQGPGNRRTLGGSGNDGVEHDGDDSGHSRRRHLRSASPATDTTQSAVKDSTITSVHPHDDDGSRLLLENSRIQVHYRVLKENNDLVHVYQYLLQ